MFLSHLVIAGTFLTILITIIRDIIRGTAKKYKLPLIGMVAVIIAVILEMTEVYRVVSMSGIFVGAGLMVLLVVTLIQSNGSHPRIGAGTSERGQGKPGLSDRSSYAS